MVCWRYEVYQVALDTIWHQVLVYILHITNKPCYNRSQKITDSCLSVLLRSSERLQLSTLLWRNYVTDEYICSHVSLDFNPELKASTSQNIYYHHIVGALEHILPSYSGALEHLLMLPSYSGGILCRMVRQKD